MRRDPSTSSRPTHTAHAVGRASDAAHTWTRADLEAFADGELSADVARRLTDDLLPSASLRRELQSVRELDSLTVRALLESPQPRPQAHALPTTLTSRMGEHARSLAIIAAAALLVLVAAFAMRGRLPSTPSDPSPLAAAPVPETAAPAATSPTSSQSPAPQPNPATITLAALPPRATPRGVRVVFAIPMGEPSAEDEPSRSVAQARFDSPAESPSITELASNDAGDTALPDIALPKAHLASHTPQLLQTQLLQTQLQQALARNDIPASATILASADEATRAELFAVVGRSLFSAHSVSRLLDELPGEVAVDLCSDWLRSGTQRPIVMKHLGRAATDPALRDRVHLAVHGILERQPQLRPWMTSYASWAVTQPPPVKDKNGAGLQDAAPASTSIAQLDSAILPSVDRG